MEAGARLLYQGLTKALTMTAEPLAAQTAADWGLIWKAVDDDALMDEATALARKLAGGATLGLGMTKRLIQEAQDNDFDAHLDRERDLQRQAGESADYAEGVAAFLDKRPPAWTAH